MHLIANHLAVTQLDHAALHLVDESGFVGGHQHGGAAGVDAGQQLHDVDRGGGVEVSGRLVGEQHLRTIDQSARDRDALLLAAGELVRHPLLLAVETHERQGLRNSLLDEAARRTRHLKREGDVLVDGLRRQKSEVLEDRSDVAAEVRHLAVGEHPQVSAEHRDPPRRRDVFAQDQAQTGGFAGARGADEEDELPALHFEVDTGEGGLRRPAVAFRDVLEPNHGATSLSAGSPLAASDTPHDASVLRPDGDCSPSTTHCHVACHCYT